MATNPNLKILLLIFAVLPTCEFGCGSSQIAAEAATQPTATVASAAELPIDESKDENPVFPSDRGGKLLEELLTPWPRANTRFDVTTSPRRAPASDWPEPTLLPQPSAAPLPRLAIETPTKKYRPTPVPEPLPLFDQFASPRLPEAPYFPVPPRLRVPSPDVNQPIPLPILGQQVLDRPGLDDPTVEASMAIALALSPPLRNVPVPFLRLVLPNPFEHRDAIQMRRPPAEDPTPVTTTPRVPTKQ